MKRILISALLLTMLAACSKQQYAGLQQCGTDQNGNQACVQVQPGQVAQQQYAPAPPVVVAPQQPVQYVQAPQQPVIVQQDNSGSNLAAGVAIGMMAHAAMAPTYGSYGHPGYQDNSSYNKTVINKTVNVTNVIHQAPTAVAPVAPPVSTPRVTQSLSIPAARPAPSYAPAARMQVTQTASFKTSSSNFGGFGRRK
jgi:hypothetical protein